MTPFNKAEYEKHCRTLGVAGTEPREQIQTIYRQLVTQNHPDVSLAAPAEATRRTALANVAYSYIEAHHAAYQRVAAVERGASERRRRERATLESSAEQVAAGIKRRADARAAQSEKREEARRQRERRERLAAPGFATMLTAAEREALRDEFLVLRHADDQTDEVRDREWLAFVNERFGAVQEAREQEAREAALRRAAEQERQREAAERLRREQEAREAERRAREATAERERQAEAEATRREQEKERRAVEERRQARREVLYAGLDALPLSFDDTASDIPVIRARFRAWWDGRLFDTDAKVAEWNRYVGAYRSAKRRAQENADENAAAQD